MIVDGYHYDKSLFIRDREDGKIHKIYYNTLGNKFLTKKHDFDYEALAYSIGEEEISSCSEFIIKSTGGYGKILRSCMDSALFPTRIRIMMMLGWINLMADHYDKHIKISKQTESGMTITIKNGIDHLYKAMNGKGAVKEEMINPIMEFYPEIYDETFKFDTPFQKLLYGIASAFDFTSRSVMLYDLADDVVNEHLTSALNSIFYTLDAKNEVIKSSEFPDISKFSVFYIIEKMIDIAFDITKNSKKEL